MTTADQDFLPVTVRRLRCVMLVWLALASAAAHAQRLDEPDWSGNFGKNPGFEEDFVNARGEGHVLSFKGDWYYNQKDLTPDFWLLHGEWAWGSDNPHSGDHYLRLAEGARATQVYPGAVYQAGGGNWGGTGSKPMKVEAPEKLAQAWRASVWVRGGGTLTLGSARAKAKPSADWQLLSVELTSDKVNVTDAMTVTLSGPGEFDDLVVQERLPTSPNLIPNAGFEQADASGLPQGWSPQTKYRDIGPTYYVWTDWNHAFRANQGSVTVDPLVSHGGKQSLRFDVHPGDEKYIESELITLNQTTPGVIEVGVYVRADRIRLFDIRCVDQDGVDLPSYRPIQPENGGGGTSTWGCGTFGWRYVRKFFAPTFDRPMKGIRVRLCARGFNGHTLDDTGTRSYASQVGTLWWDSLRVTERAADEAALLARGVQPQPPEAPASGELADVDVDLGERFYGQNRLGVSLTNTGAAASFKVRLTTTLPGLASVTTESPAVRIAADERALLETPYEIHKLVGDLKDQGKLRVELLRADEVVADTTYSFNTWPVVIDFDVARTYSLPQENPVAVAMNLGVGRDTLKQLARLELVLAKASDPRQVIDQLPPIVDLSAAFAQTLAELPKTKDESYQHNLPAPGWWTDRTNLLMLHVDLGKLKVWAHDNPTRDTVLVARGVDAAGNVLFEDKSDPFCRMQPPPRQPAIESVEVREDGAILINDRPRFLTGVMYASQHFVNDEPQTMAQLGVMGHRLWGKAGGYFEGQLRLFDGYGLYALQTKPINLISGHHTARAFVELTDDQKADFAEFVQVGGMKNTVSINTGGWEARIPDTPEDREKHQALNDWIRQVSKRPIAYSPSGAYNAWGDPMQRPYYDILHAETEMWGPMDYNTIAMPYMRRLKNTPTTWVYLPQLYENTPYERYRFETYENIIRGAAGVEMIHGTGDPTLTRGLAGELRGLEEPLNSLEEAPAVTFKPNVSHKVTRYKDKTYILATNCGPIAIGNWTWNDQIKHSGAASHEGDTVNSLWFRPNGIRIHGFRGMPMPELIQKGDKVIQYVWLDPEDTPEWVMVAVRGDGRFAHNAVLGKFDFEKFKADYGNIIMFSELNHSVWHQIYWAFDSKTYEQAIRLMGQEWADKMKSAADNQRDYVDKIAYQAEHFKSVPGDKPANHEWIRIELDAEEYGLVGKLVDGFAYLTQNGRALWDYSVLERDGQIVRVFCEDSVGIDRSLLTNVRVNVPGLKAGTPIKALFEDREIIAKDGYFTDNFEGVDSYQYEGWAPEGDLVGYVKDPNRELPRLMPGGYGYKYGPTAVRIYEIPQ